MSDVIRLQIELNSCEEEQLKETMQDCGVRTKKELVCNALALLRWAIRQRKAGRNISANNPEGGVVHELSMPILDIIPKQT